MNLYDIRKIDGFERVTFDGNSVATFHYASGATVVYTSQEADYSHSMVHGFSLTIDGNTQFVDLVENLKTLLTTD